jgi:hypothetical protein
MNRFRHPTVEIGCRATGRVSKALLDHLRVDVGLAHPASGRVPQPMERKTVEACGSNGWLADASAEVRASHRPAPGAWKT